MGIIDLFMVVITFLFFSCSNAPERPGISPGFSDGRGPEINESSDIEVFFTKPGESTEFEDKISEIFNSVEEGEICLEMYEFDNEKIILSLEKAVERGVKLKFVGDLDEFDKQPGYKRLALALDKKYREVKPHGPTGCDEHFNLVCANGIMHNKVALIKTKKMKSVLTGSANFSDNCIYYNNNNMVLIKNDQVYECYKNEFNYLMGDFDKRVSGVHSFKTENAVLEIFFIFPDSGVEGSFSPLDILCDEVMSSFLSVDFMIFSFNERSLADSMIARKKNGISVRGIFDDFQSSNGQYSYMREHGLDVRLDGNLSSPHPEAGGGMMHDKVMILDKSDVERARVITGSFNWSNSAESSNAENILIIHSPEIASKYYDEFINRWEEAE